MIRNNYLLKFRRFYLDRIIQLKRRVHGLYDILQKEEFLQNENVKLLARLQRAILDTIPENPNRIDYMLKGPLSKFRRFKQGLQRYRLIFCFAKNAPIIVYLYINDDEHLRKDGDKNDPYEEFNNLLNKGFFSHDPDDPKMEKWISNEITFEQQSTEI